MVQEMDEKNEKMDIDEDEEKEKKQREQKRMLESAHDDADQQSKRAKMG